jgi:hypothetical protein
MINVNCYYRMENGLGHIIICRYWLEIWWYEGISSEYRPKVDIRLIYLVSPNLKLIYVLLFYSTKIIRNFISCNYRKYLAKRKTLFPIRTDINCWYLENVIHDESSRSIFCWYFENVAHNESSKLIFFWYFENVTQNDSSKSIFLHFTKHWIIFFIMWCKSTNQDPALTLVK